MFFGIILLLIYNQLISQIISFEFHSLSKYSILPVFHNLEPDQCYGLVDIIKDKSICSISLRHENALISLKRLIYELNYNSLTSTVCKVGVSTVISEQQIIDAKSFGACFLSTISTKKDICDLSHKYKLPILCGCATFEDTMSAVDLYQVQALKFYPSTKVLPNDLKVILTKLSSYFENFKKLNHYRDNLRIFVAGSVKKEDLKSYISAGATDFAIGFDMKTLSLSQIQETLTAYEQELSSICSI